LVRYDWDNGSVVTVPATQTGPGIFQATATNTYTSRGDICNYHPRATLVVNGVICTSSSQDQIVTVWDDDDHNGGRMNINPVISALIFSSLGAVGINSLKRAKIYGDVAIAIFFSAGLAVAVVILSLAKGFNVDLFSYLFGSILTVNETDLQVMLGLGIFILGTVVIFYKELFYITFDEISARASGIPVEKLNTLLVVLTAITVVISLKIVGILLVSSLLVVPVATSLQISRNFKETILISMIFAILSVVVGLIISFYFNLASGGAIVLTSVIVFLIVMIYKNRIG